MLDFMSIKLWNKERQPLVLAFTLSEFRAVHIDKR